MVLELRAGIKEDLRNEIASMREELQQQLDAVSSDFTITAARVEGNEGRIGEIGRLNGWPTSGLTP